MKGGLLIVLCASLVACTIQGGANPEFQGGGFEVDANGTVSLAADVVRVGSAECSIGQTMVRSADGVSWECATLASSGGAWTTLTGEYEGDISYDGNVGIRTSEPEIALHILGPDEDESAMRLENSFADHLWDVVARRDGNFTVVNGDVTTTGEDALTLAATGGNLGVGESQPGARVEIAGGGVRTNPLQVTLCPGPLGSCECPHGTTWRDDVTSDGQVEDGECEVAGLVVATGNVGLGVAAPTAPLDVGYDTLRLRLPKTPASSSAPCNQGELSWDADYVYVCVQPDTWKRATLATW